MKSMRKQRGAVTAFVAVLSLLLSILTLGLFQFVLYFNGANDTRNATDSGALNVGQQSLTISTTAKTPAEHQFDDVADAKGQFTLTNINRVWGKALLANLNVDAMNADGYGSGSANAHADELFNAAQSISDRLSEQLNNPSKHKSSFDKISTQNAVNPLGTKTQIQADADDQWRTSLVDRGSESNIQFNKDQLPSSSHMQLIEPVAGKGGQLFVPGYKPIKILGKKIVLVPFKEGERPQLISADKFNSNTQQASPLRDWQKPVPNAFSAGGKSVNHEKLGQSAVAYVQTNPQRKFDLGFPRAFVRIRLDKNTVRYIHNGIPRKQGSYAFQTEEQIEGPFDSGSGSSFVNASLGLEYAPPTLFQAIYALPGDHSQVTEALLQRCREIKKDISKAELIALLQLPLVPYANEYIIFPIKKSLLVAMPSITAKGTIPGLDFLAGADGDEREICTEYTAGMPNTATVNLYGAGEIVVPPFAMTVEHGHLNWKPGSGYDGCLGELSIKRETEVLSFGYMVPVP